MMKTWTKCFGGWKETVNNLYFKNSGLIKVTSAIFGLGWKSSCKVDESWRHTHPHTHMLTCKSTISDFSMKLYRVPISQLRQWRHALFWSLGPFQGCPDWPWHCLARLLVFSALFAREYCVTADLRDFQAFRKMLFDHWTNSSWLLRIKNCYSAEIKPKQHSGS